MNIDDIRAATDIDLVDANRIDTPNHLGLFHRLRMEQQPVEHSVLSNTSEFNTTHP